MLRERPLAGGTQNTHRAPPLAAPSHDSRRLLLEAAASLETDLATRLGSGLAFRMGRPEEVLPRMVRELVCAAAGAPSGGPADTLVQVNAGGSANALVPGTTGGVLAGCTAGSSGCAAAGAGPVSRVDLLYMQEPLAEATDVETTVEEAFLTEATGLGVACAVRRFWGSTLFHADDLPAPGRCRGGGLRVTRGAGAQTGVWALARGKIRKPGRGAVLSSLVQAH
jgi:hypothetical protein